MAGRAGAQLTLIPARAGIQMHHNRIKKFGGQQATGIFMDEAAEMSSHSVDALRYSTINAGTSVLSAEVLEDWEGGDDLVICPDANSGCADCQSCPCAEVHSRSECHEWVNVWGDHKKSCGSPECDLVDQEQYDEIHYEEPWVLDRIYGYGDISPRAAADVTTKLLKQGQPQLLFKKFSGVTNPLPKSNSPITFRRYAFPDEEKSAEDMLSDQLEKTDEAQEKRKVTRKNPHS